MGAEVESKDGGDEDGMASFPQFWYVFEFRGKSRSVLMRCQRNMRETDHDIRQQHTVLFPSVG